MDKSEFEDSLLRILPHIDVDTLQCLHSAAEVHAEQCPPDVFYKVVLLSISRVLVQEGEKKALELADMQWATLDPEEILRVGCMVSYYEGATDMDSLGEWAYAFLWAASNPKPDGGTVLNEDA